MIQIFQNKKKCLHLYVINTRRDHFPYNDYIYRSIVECLIALEKNSMEGNFSGE